MTETNNNQPILLVEDNPVDLDLTLRALKSQKLENPILTARDGEEAIAYIEKWEKGDPRPVVILLDLKMPKVNGLEVLKEIKSHPVFKSIPVVVLTTSSETTDVREAYQLGANSYIVKPVDFEKFLDVAKQIDLYWRVLNKTDDNIKT
ncbi:Response regulator receiver domain-containing protein [Tangfeifania diversioriginum]|uniref:Response regulator receiver domain-containing protein n=1 Tax=Tangfeifania diversioriginum TaxID=1168035 RepID=A0A1M6NJF9_9BACT|nr:response regulator [Tangfeifania diversioriginum]SHJ95764.1 Response regulator receiver domain-containing protein [Tangfeifania diversioriginum]